MTTRAKKNRLPRRDRAIALAFPPGAAALAAPPARSDLVELLAAADGNQVNIRLSRVERRPIETARKATITTARRIAARAMMTLGGKASTRAKAPAEVLPARRMGSV